MLQKILTIFTHLTVEPIFFAYAVSFTINHLASQELYIQKVCLVNLGYDKEVCRTLQSTIEEQNNVQKLAAKFQTARRTMGVILSLTLTFLSGPWSDRYGRKPILILTLMGSLLESIVFIVNSIWFNQFKAEFMLFEIVSDCMGGLPTISMATFAYVADIASTKDRTKRMGILFGVFQIGVMIGITIGSTASNAFGFITPFSISSFVAVMSLLYSTFVLKESNKIEKEHINAEQENRSTNNLFILWRTMRFFHMKKVFVDFRRMRQNCHPEKWKLLVIVYFCYTVEGFVLIGELDFTYLYTRKKLDYTLLDYMYFANTVRLVSVLTQFVFVPMLSEFFNFRDSTISVLDATTSVIQNIIVACATKSWMLYLSVAVAFLDSSSFPILKSIISKLLGPNEAGRGISGAQVIGGIAKLLAVPIFGQIYWHTVAFFPQAIFFLMAGLYLTYALLMLYVDIILRRSNYLEERKLDKNIPNNEYHVPEEAVEIL